MKAEEYMPGLGIRDLCRCCQCYEAVLRTLSGDRMPILISSAPISDEVGQVTGIVNVLRDISRGKELARMKSEIIQSVSYEFRKALLAIIRMIKKMLEGDVGERIPRVNIFQR
jgi:signal transduction histidine kinase